MSSDDSVGHVATQTPWPHQLLLMHYYTQPEHPCLQTTSNVNVNQQLQHSGGACIQEPLFEQRVQYVSQHTNKFEPTAQTNTAMYRTSGTAFEGGKHNPDVCNPPCIKACICCWLWATFGGCLVPLNHLTQLRVIYAGPPKCVGLGDSVPPKCVGLGDSV